MLAKQAYEEFNTDWVLIVLGEDMAGRRLPDKSWLIICYNQSVLSCREIDHASNRSREPATQKVLIHFLYALTG